LQLLAIIVISYAPQGNQFPTKTHQYKKETQR